MSEKSKRKQQQKWLRTSHSCKTSWLLVVTQKSQSGQTVTLEPSALVQLKMCGASQYKPNRSKSTSRTFERRCVFVKACPMLIARAHACSSCSSLSSCSSQRVGALSLIPICLGISGHTVHWKAVGGPNKLQHSSKEQKHGKHFSLFFIFIIFLFFF